MAGVSRPGFEPTAIQDPGFGPFLPGTTAGKIMWNQWQNGQDSTLQAGGQPDPDLSDLSAGILGTHTAVPTVPVSAPASVGRAGLTIDNSPGNFFEKIHILPRTKIDFGNIITLITNPFLIHSGFRDVSTTLTSLVNGALPGIEFPDVVPPVIVPRLTSVISPTSTDNSGGVGLGTVVQTTVNATQDGLPTFDASVLFNFASPANDPLLLVTGNRVVMIPFPYEVDVIERLQFLTDVIPALDGHEQRIALRKNPRQFFDVRYALDLVERQRFETLVFDFSAGVFGLPLKHEELLLTAATSVGATLYPVANALDIDLRVGGLAVVISDSVTFDVIEIQAVTDTLITAVATSLNAYPAGTPIMPLRTTTISSGIPVTRHPVELEEFRMTFRVTDNDTGALAGDTTPGFWSTFNSRVLFDDCNVINGPVGNELTRRLWTIDNKTGLVNVSSIWDRNKRKSQKGFLARNRAEILTLRKLFIGLRGKQKAFYLPTFISDLTLDADLVTGLDTMDIVSVGYTRFAQTRLPFTLLHIEFTDDTVLDRVVQSSVIVSTTVERLTMDTTWPANRTVSETRRIEFYELVRFDSDEMRLLYQRAGQASTRLPVLRVFDDNA